MFKDWLAEMLAERRDLSTMHVAAQLGVLDGEVEDWLAGRATPNEDHARRIATMFDVRPDEVLKLARA